MGTFVGCPFGCFKKKGGLKGLQNYVDLKAIQFHILTSWSQNKITRLADDGFIRDLVVNCVRERVNYLKYVTVRQAQHLIWHVEGERERLGAYGENCKLWGLQEINFAFWESGFAIWWDQVTAACVSKHVPPTQFIGCKLEIHQSFAQTKAAATKKSGTLKRAKKNSNSKQLGYVPAAISPLFLREKRRKCQNFWELVAAGIFVRVLLSSSWAGPMILS